MLIGWITLLSCATNPVGFTEQIKSMFSFSVELFHFLWGRCVNDRWLWGGLIPMLRKHDNIFAFFYCLALKFWRVLRFTSVQCHYKAVIYLTNIHKDNSSLVKARYGVSFMGPPSDWYSASVPAIIYAISYQIITALDCIKKDKNILISQSNTWLLMTWVRFCLRTCLAAVSAKTVLRQF